MTIWFWMNHLNITVLCFLLYPLRMAETPTSKGRHENRRRSSRGSSKCTINGSHHGCSHHYLYQGTVSCERLKDFLHTDMWSYSFLWSIEKYLAVPFLSKSQKSHNCKPGILYQAPIVFSLNSRTLKQNQRRISSPASYSGTLGSPEAW